MSKKTLIQQLAAASDSSLTEAADSLDRAVEDILKQLRKGHAVELPGLGRLVPGPKTQVSLKVERSRKGNPRGRR